MKAHYPGYGQLLPWAEVQRADTEYPYVPGTVASVEVASSDRRGDPPTVSFSGDYCPPGYALARVRPVRLADAALRYEFDVGLRRQRAQSAARAEAELTLDENDIRFLRRVVVRISRARAYPLARARPGALRHASSCLMAIDGKPGLHRVTSIIAGDVTVDMAFKTNIDLSVRSGLVSKVQFALGAGYFQAEGARISGKDIVFGAKLARYARTGS
jgi:hypothetical protein